MRTATPLRTWSTMTAPREVGDVGGDLDASVHRPRVHHERLLAEQLGAAAREAELRGVLAQAGQQRFGHALPLHPQQVADVDLAERRVEVVADAHRPALDARRQQRGGRDERHLRAERIERQHVGPRDPAVLDVADDRDAEAVDPAEVLSDRVRVEQRLRRVLVPAIARVDDADSIVEPPRDLPGHAG